jgi:hypothetical protein
MKGDEAWHEFFGFLCELNAIITVRVDDEDVARDLSKAVRGLENWRVVHLERVVSFEKEIEYEYDPEDCPHDYCTSKCTGCGYEAG